MNQSLQALVCLALAAGSLLAQPVEQGFVYQGQLQAEGEAFDGTADLRFRLYDALENGNQIGLQANRDGLQVVNGLFAVTLDFGFSAFDGADRFLEIDARATGDPGFTTLAPRQRLAPTPVALTSQRPWAIAGDNTYFFGGNAGVGEVNPLVSLHLTNGPLFLGLPAIFQDDLLIEDTDAFLGLASDPGGAAGSGIAFKEIGPDGLLVDNWTLYRSTSGAGSDLRLTFGSSASYVSNTLLARLTTDGDMVISGKYQRTSRLRTLNFSANNATPLDNTKLRSFLGTPELIADDTTRSAFIIMPIHLPEGTQIKDFTMVATDFNNDSLIQMRLCKQLFGETPVQLGKVSSDPDFTDGEVSLSKVFNLDFLPVIEPDASYFLEVEIAGISNSSTAMGFQYARLTYLTTAP